MPLKYPELRLLLLTDTESSYGLTENSFYKNLWGNSGNNALSGDSSDNVLNGDAGADTLTGGAGNDVYVVDDAGDTVVEGANGGIDLVWSDISYSLPSNVENLSLRGSGDTNGDGNELGNTITGNSNGNRLDGMGGNDSLFGARGDDWLIGGAGLDTLNGGAGFDTAEFSGALSDYSQTQNADGSWTITDLRTGSPDGTDIVLNIETLQFSDQSVAVPGANPASGDTGGEIPGVLEYPELRLLGLGDGQTDYALPSDSFYLHVSGNSLSNRIFGNSSSNSLSGDAGSDTIVAGAGDDTIWGGAGNDRLSGGTGHDLFVFDTPLGTYRTDRKFNFDKLTDFNVKYDTIWLDNDIFAKLGAGLPESPVQLRKSFFKIAEKAQDRNDYIVYNKHTGILSYDVDGSGSRHAVEFAQLSKNLKLTYKDFFVF